MRKSFNDTGICIPEKHYMVDTTQKLNQMIALIDKGEYFTMNRPRQFGKTTTAFLLLKEIAKQGKYLLLNLSFEVSEEDTFLNKKNIALYFSKLLRKALIRSQNTNLVELIEESLNTLEGFETLSDLITKLCQQSEKQIIITIDEVDKASNNLLFMQFLALLRDKYLAYSRGEEASFHAVILIGVHDIKNLKRKIRPEDEHSLNSPWNIAVDFTIDLSFSVPEIKTMLEQYVRETETKMNIAEMATRIDYYSSGYPYLVSKLCKVIDEIEKKEERGAISEEHWSLEDMEASFRYLVNPAYSNTLFDDLAKNLNNNPDLYALVFDIVINGEKRSFNINNPIISLAATYGILKPDERGFCRVGNRIFEKRIYDLMLSRQETSYKQVLERSLFEGEKGELLLQEVLISFQNFMREQHSHKDNLFLEREGRLLFLSFLKPILNGKGFDFKEPVVGDERRIDLVITYNPYRYVLELKRWQGERYHQKGLQQLSDYLDLYHLKEGYLLIYDFRKEKEYKQEQIEFQDKSIFAVWV